MRTFTHVFNTWLLAHALHALLFPLFDYINTGHFEIAFFVAALLIGPVVSIPALLLSWFFFQFLFVTQGSNMSRILLWLLSATIALLVNLLLFRIFEPFVFSDGLLFIAPALLSCWISILLRRYQLNNFFTSNEIENEANLV